MKLPAKEGPSTSRGTASILYQQKVGRVCERINTAWQSPPVSEQSPTLMCASWAKLYVCVKLIQPGFTASGVFLCFPRGHAASPQTDVLPAVWLRCGKVWSQYTSTHLYESDSFLTYKGTLSKNSVDLTFHQDTPSRRWWVLHSKGNERNCLFMRNGLQIS